MAMSKKQLVRLINASVGEIIAEYQEKEKLKKELTSKKPTKVKK